MQGRFDMHLHAGDIAYDMPLDHGATGDLFSNQVSRPQLSYKAESDVHAICTLDPQLLIGEVEM